MTVHDQRLRDDPAFVRFWLSRVISIAGSGVTYVALPVLVYRLTGSPLITGLVTAVESLPYLAIGLVAGAIADRRDRRRVMVVGDVVSAVVVATVPLAAALGRLTAVHALLVAAALATAFVFFDAAEFGALPTLVGSERLPAANSAVWGASTLVEIVTPAAAGAALVALSPSTLLAVDAASFFLSALLIRGIRRALSQPRGGERRRMRQDIAEGLRFLWHESTVRTMSFVGAAQSVSGGAFVGQLVVYADRAFGVHQGDARLGLVYGVWGFGSLAATTVLPWLVRRAGAARITLLAMPISATLALALAVAPSYAAALVLTALWGGVYMLVVVNAITFRQQNTPEHLQSRVNVAGRMLSWGLGWPVGALLGGAVAAVAGVRVALVAAALVTAVGAALAFLSPLRRASG